MKAKPTLDTIYYTDPQIEQFYRSMKELTQHVGCTYLSYFVEDLSNKRRIGFASNPDWQREYMGAKLIDNCHLCRTVNDQFVKTERKLLIFPWESVAAITPLEKEICLYRAENGIGANGISFCSQYKGIREFFAIAPDNKNPNFLYHVSKNITLVRRQLIMFRKVGFSDLD